MDPNEQKKVKAVRAIILNEAAQYLIKETLSSIDAELLTLRRKTSVESQQMQRPEYGGSQINYMAKPFFKIWKGDCPPSNEDTITRIGFKETNFCDDLNSLRTRLSDADVVKIILTVVDRYQKNTIAKVTERRDARINALAVKRKPSQTVSDRATLLQELRKLNAELHHLTFVRPTELPKELVALLVNKAKWTADDPKALAAHQALEKYIASNRSLSQISVKEWISILNNAVNVLTDLDWAYIANHVLKGARSSTFIRLCWIHRILPKGKRGTWSKEELARLASLVAELGSRGHWKKIADRLGTERNAFNCYRAWNSLLNSENPHKSDWSVEEDAHLQLLVTHEASKMPLSLIDWKVIGALHMTRTGEECKQRVQVICPEFASLVNKAGSDFNQDEDLALLLSVQRRGVGGGRHGRGGGLGAGCWAVVASDMPGRSANDCQQRYITLCEQLRPWSHSDDRKLFQCAVRLRREHSGKLTMKNPYYCRLVPEYLPFFPGRSSGAIKARTQDLFKFAAVLQRLREVSQLARPGKKSSITSNSNAEVSMPTELRQFKSLLFQSSILTEFLTDLKARGVSDPEEYAFQSICSWTPSTSKEPNDFLDDLLNFLIDLETGALLPSASPLPTKADSVHPGSNESNAEADQMRPPLPFIRLNTLTGKKTKELLWISQVKSVLAPDLRESIKEQTAQIFKSFHKPEVSSIRSEQSRLRRLSVKLDKYSVPCEYEEACNLLLGNESVFWKTLDEVCREQNLTHIMNDYNHIRSMQSVVDEIAYEMLLSAMAYASVFSPSAPMAEDKITDLDEIDSDQQRNGEENLKPKVRRPGNIPMFLPELGPVFRRKLLRLHRLLKKTRQKRKCKCMPEYFFGKGSRYLPPQSRLPSTMGEFPLMHHLPEDHVKNYLQCSEEWWQKNACLTESRTAEYLGVTEAISVVQDEPTVPLDWKAMRAMPPNDGTVLAFNNLLHRLPDLFNRGQEFITRLTKIRNMFGYFKNERPGSVSIPDPSLVDDTFTVGANASLVISSPHHSAFVARCLSVFLWPCIMANIPARNYVDSAVRAVELARMIAPAGPSSRKPMGLSLKRKRDLDGLNDFVGFEEPSNKLPRCRNEHANFWRLDWITLGIDSADGLIQVDLPPSVERLVRSGFRPTEFLSTVSSDPPLLL